MNIDQFWDLFRQDQNRLQSLDPAEAADSIEFWLRQVDPRLGVEVCREGSHTEVTITASGDKDAFEAAETLVQKSLKFDRWRFVALKPPRGFDFDLSIDGRKLRASDLFFEPLNSSQFPDLLGIRIYANIPLPGEEEMTDLLSMIVETGIGEKSASRIAFIEAAAQTPQAVEDALPIHQLGEYIDWHERNRGRTN